MERSQSYTSFETTSSGSKKGNYNNLNRSNSNFNNINNNNNNNSNNNNDIYNFNKNKFASTSSLNLRKALEMRQTQLQRQQQQQQENLQRQQWQLLYEQRRQQQLQQKQQLQLQQLQQLQHAASSDNLLNAPLYLSSLNGLQLLQKRRQKMLQRQKSTTSIDELDFPHTSFAINNDNDTDEDDDYEVTLRENLLSNNINQNDEGNNEHQNKLENINIHDDVNDNDLTITPTNQTNQILNTTPALQQKLLQFQRQRPYSEATLNYRATSPLAIINNNYQNQSQSLVNSPTLTSAITTSTTGIQQSTMSTIQASSTALGRRLQQYDQSLSFDSAISNTTSSTCTTTPNTASILNNDNMSPLSRRHPNFGKLKRDNSIHSDSSRYSSVDSLLEARKPDPEAILINLGFGPVVSEDILSRIPKRFLKPSQVRGIDTDAFVRRLQLANSLADHSVLGYRGLIGNPDLPPSTIVAKIMQRFEVNERKKSMGSIEQTLR